MTTSLTIQQLRRRVLAVCAGAGLALLIAAGVATMRKSSRPPELNRERFDEARELWQSRTLLNYDVTVQVTGRQPGTYAVHVRDGAAESATLDGRPLRNLRTLGTWSVPGMFATIGIDLKNNEKVGYLMLGAEFDPQWGFPQRYQRIEMRTGAHDALLWNVVSFVPE
jgi:hypothetical protein